MKPEPVTPRTQITLVYENGKIPGYALKAQVSGDGQLVKLLEYEVNPDDCDLISHRVLARRQINRDPILNSFLRYVD